MQLIVTLHAYETVLPMAYRHYQQAMLYSAVRQSDPSYASYLHKRRSDANEHGFDLFTFGALKGNYKAKNECICFHGDIRFEVRSADPYFLLALSVAWKPGAQVRLGDNELTVVKCCMRNHAVSANRIRIRTIAPIVAYTAKEDGSTVFYAPNEPQFCDLIYDDAVLKWRSFTGENDVPEFSCVPVLGSPLKKQVTKFYHTRINAWFGEFELFGDCRILNLLYHTGLGTKSSQGFGMFSCVGTV